MDFRWNQMGNQKRLAHRVTNENLANGQIVGVVDGYRIS